ncbi:MAG: hypothetical protein ACOC6B_07100 [Thermodesulfobacteriota bacterium]
MNNNGLVFLFGARPYLCRRWGDEDKLWLFYWHQNHWVSLREADPGEAFPRNLSETEQDMYHKRHKEWEQKLKDLYEQ